MRRFVTIVAITIGGLLSVNAYNHGGGEQQKTTSQKVEKRNLRSKDYKNYKPWMHKNKETTSLVTTKKHPKYQLKSKDFKNYKPWQHKSKEVSTSNTVKTNKNLRRNLRSKDYKNYKPWKK